METIKVRWKHGEINTFIDDSVISDSLILYGEWAQNEIDFLEFLVKDQNDHVIVLGGANIGVQTICLSNAVGKDKGELHAFELHPTIYSALHLNLSISGCDNIKIYCSGLSDTIKPISVPDLKRDNNNVGSFSLHTKYSTTNTIESNLTTIDSLELDNCTLIHLDVENHELQCLRGAAKTIKAYHPDIYAEVLSENEGVVLYNYLKNLYSSCYFHFPKAFNKNNFKNESKDMFNSNRECAIVCSERSISHPDLYEVSSDAQISKLFKTIYSYRQLLPQINSNNNSNIRSDQYVVQLYVDSGGGFHESNSIVKYIHSNYAKIEFDLSNYSNIANLRLDPHIDRCIIKLHSANWLIDQEYIPVEVLKGSNFYLHFDSYYLFDGTDPRLILGGYPKRMIQGGLHLVIEYYDLNEKFVKSAFELMSTNSNLLLHRLKELNKDIAQQDHLNFQFVKRNVSSLSEEINTVLSLQYSLEKDVFAIRTFSDELESKSKLLLDQIRDVDVNIKSISESNIAERIDYFNKVVDLVNDNKQNVDANFKSFERYLKFALNPLDLKFEKLLHRLELLEKEIGLSTWRRFLKRFRR